MATFLSPLTRGIIAEMQKNPAITISELQSAFPNRTSAVIASVIRRYSLVNFEGQWIIPHHLIASVTPKPTESLQIVPFREYNHFPEKHYIMPAIVSLRAGSEDFRAWPTRVGNHYFDYNPHP